MADSPPITIIRAAATPGGGASGRSPAAPLLPRDFVAGPENRLPAAVVDGPLAVHLKTLSPVLFYGPPLVGKTMLMSTLIRRLADARGQGVLQIAAPDFARQAGEVRSRQQLSAWRKALTQLRAIAFDAIEDLGQHPSAQAEFAHLTEDAAKRGVILLGAARTPPAQWPLDDRVASRWSAGLCVPVQRPGPEARALLIERLAAFYQLTTPPQVATKLAAAMPLTAGETCGRLAPWLTSLCEAGGCAEITPALADAFLAAQKTQPPELSEIITAVCRELKLKPAEVKSKSRRRTLALARGAVTLLARELTDASFTAIGQALGGRDHTTAMNAYRSLLKHCESDNVLRESVERVRERLIAR